MHPEEDAHDMIEQLGIILKNGASLASHRVSRVNDPFRRYVF